MSNKQIITVQSSLCLKAKFYLTTLLTVANHKDTKLSFRFLRFAKDAPFIHKIVCTASISFMKCSATRELFAFNVFMSRTMIISAAIHKALHTNVTHT